MKLQPHTNSKCSRKYAGIRLGRADIQQLHKLLASQHNFCKAMNAVQAVKHETAAKKPSCNTAWHVSR